MFFRFQCNRVADFLVEFGIGAAAAKKVAQRYFVFLPQTQVDVASCRQPHTVAGGAEVLAHRRNQAEGEAAAAVVPVAGGAAADAAFKRGQAEFPAQVFQYGLQVDFGVHLAGRPHRHGFDEVEDEAVLDAERDHIVQIGVVDAFERNHVDFDALETGFFGGGDAFQYLRQAVAAGDAGHAVAAQAVEADIEAAHACRAQGAGLLAEAGAVGGQGNVFDAGLTADFGGQFGQALAQQGFAAGEAETFGAQPREGGGNAGGFFYGQPVFRHGKALKAFGQAVSAAQIAAVGYGNSQVIDGAAEWVCQHSVFDLSLGIMHLILQAV